MKNIIESYKLEKKYDFDWSRNWVYINKEYKLFNFGYFVKII